MVSRIIFIVKWQDEIYLASETGNLPIVNAMVKVQDLDPPRSFKSCKDLYVHFCQKVLMISLDQCQAR